MAGVENVLTCQTRAGATMRLTTHRLILLKGASLIPRGSISAAADRGASRLKLMP